jgi:protein gp37
MSEHTKIEWATASWNPWIGCTKVSPGCLNCYAEKSAPTRVARADGRELWGKGHPRQRTSAANWKLPIKWNIAAGLSGGERPRIFPSLCDWLDDEVPIEWLADLLNLIYLTQNLDWLLLTKRPQNFLKRMDAAAALWACDGSYWETPQARAYHSMISPWRVGAAPRNVWVGVSVEDQARADERIPWLLPIPARVRFLSVEPLIGAVDLFTDEQDPPVPHGSGGIDWVIVGGESGAHSRPCNTDWIRRIVKLCKYCEVPVFVKQLGAFVIEEKGSQRRRIMFDHPKGGDPSEWPDDLRVRKFPEAR